MTARSWIEQIARSVMRLRGGVLCHRLAGNGWRLASAIKRRQWSPQTMVTQPFGKFSVSLLSDCHMFWRFPQA